ncbi:hypothetical protein GCM10023231_18950 [Olivibacter ginsenosidimutans]|uniref:Uncharacterized protein n=1 Tax=Olivibacter ginsenosidimutans TaxID=1176537 RepID=A0ABP9B6S7_9SPHI
MQQDNGLRSLLEALDLDEACEQLLEIAETNKVEQLTDIQQVFDLISDIGRLFDVSAKAETLRENMEERIHIVIHKLKFIATDQRPRVALIQNGHNLLRNHYLDTLIKTAGGRIVNPDEADAGLLIFLAEGMYQLLGELPVLLDQPQWKTSAAVEKNNVFLVEHSQHLQGNLLHAADDVELLAQLLYPQYFVFSESGASWMKFEL